MYIKDNQALKEEWYKLYENVISAYSNASETDTAPTDSKRPKSNILNLLLDAVSLKFAELEKKCGAQTMADEPVQVELKTPEREPYTEPVNAKNNDDTTDDEDAFFKSPSLVRYKLKVLDRTRSAGKSSPVSPVMDTEVITNKEFSPTIGALLTPENLKRKKQNRYKRNLAMESPILACPDEFPPTNDSGTTSEKENDILEESIVTFDATPPAQLPTSRRTFNNAKSQETLNESVASFNSTILPQKHRSLSLSTKKKEAWIIPEAAYHKPSGGKSSFYKKRTKQLSLLSMVKNLTQKNVDVTTLKEHTGGSWSANDTVNNPNHNETNCTPAKRKSDEILHKSLEKRDRLDSICCSETFFEISPIKLNVISPRKPSTPPSPSSPVRPSTSRVINPVKNSKSSKTDLHEKFESTFDIIKDFDRIPNRGTSPTFKYKPEVVRKKQERAQLPGWDCAECRMYYQDLESQMDERELARMKNKCSKHKSKFQVDLNSTPEGFWDTRAPSTPDLYAKGYIRVASAAFTPLPPRRRKSDSSESESEITD